MAQINNRPTVADTIFDVENIFFTDVDMREALQVNMDFSLSGSVIEFLPGRKMNELKQKIPPGKTTKSKTFGKAGDLNNVSRCKAG